MDHITLSSFFEYALLFLGGGVAVLKFFPAFRTIAMFLQVVVFCFNLLKTYLKHHPGEVHHIQKHLTQMSEHYFRTHPEGIAATSELTMAEYQKHLTKQNK